MRRQDRKLRYQRQRNALQRYEKERQRNVLAQPGAHDFVLVLDHLKAGFNIPKIFRSAEAFGAREVHLIDVGPFDPAPAKGAFRKVPARFHERFRDCYTRLQAQGYVLFRLDARCENTTFQTALPQKSAFILGNEGLGISFDPADYPDIRCLAIPRSGTMDSLNVSVAASIMMYEYVRQYGQN
ncbi:MAG TPA: TrmH family RNA methyltransferase [Chromatiales bacterium]|nr:TrmH family RNA methyltransferase [Chromatiales bacterium]